jgi:hypothetical protein
MLIVFLRRPHTLHYKALIATKKSCIKFCHGRKLQRLKVIHFVFTL